LKVSVSTIPGCKLATKTFGFSDARNSRNLIKANLEPMYADSPGNIEVGRAAVPVVTPKMVAWAGFAVGRKTLAATIGPFTFV
jgi:hypothetical protein